ncbi:MAG: hypothetical protein R3F59_19265 [Myxococcota bacterium]
MEAAQRRVSRLAHALDQLAAGRDEVAAEVSALAARIAASDAAIDGAEAHIAAAEAALAGGVPRARAEALEARIVGLQGDRRGHARAVTRLAAIQRLHAEHLDAVERLERGVSALHAAAVDALEALDEQIGGLAAEERRRQLARALGADLGALRDRVARINRDDTDDALLLTERLDRLADEVDLLAPLDPAALEAEREITVYLRDRTVGDAVARARARRGRPMAIELAGDAARAWAADHAAALRALRLNRQFPPWLPLADTVRALAAGGSLRLDEHSALPTALEWGRARADRELPAEGPRQAYLAALHATEPPAARRIEVALRHTQADGRGQYRVVVDRVDLATGTVARYTLLVSDVPGERISAGELELEAAPAFAEQLALLGTQDAALAFAVLREAGVGVDEVIRGVVGPGVLPGRAGPEALRGAIAGYALSACLERVSVDLPPGEGQIDDPVLRPVTVPAGAADFGLSARRKWAVARGDAPAVTAWLRDRRSRNLVYDYEGRGGERT